ncbi:ABC transporter ATP-binding protein [Providencia rettgeri]|uniref:ABC transporter ATP-binding protein n=1 Tax=Providencia rettgeri TaxID=587 RepID=UPI0021D4A8A9|nr:ABC transporter ATP-binding protein [Providencia rettgeri]WIE09590.1 ABC transporter ATP-binding protein [Providencia rettgeri]
MLHIEQLSLTRNDGGRDFHVTLPSLVLEPGQVCALTGLSGCGKSTLLEMIGLILQPDQLTHYQLTSELNITEAVLHDDAKFLAQLRATHFGFVLQNGGLLPYLTVQQNIVLPRKILSLSTKSDWLDFAIDHLQLRHLLNNYPHQLSIGERQRVAFVRAIAHQPTLLLADEPTAALDPLNAQSLYSLIIEMVKNLNLSALIVSHDWTLVEQFGFTQYHAEIEGNGSVFRKK